MSELSNEEEKKWRECCRKAIIEFNESGALATSHVSDALRHAYFRAGYLSACKARTLENTAVIQELEEKYRIQSIDLSQTYDDFYRIEELYAESQLVIKKLKQELKEAEELGRFEILTIQDMKLPKEIARQSLKQVKELEDK